MTPAVRSSVSDAACADAGIAGRADRQYLRAVPAPGTLCATSVSRPPLWEGEGAQEAVDAMPDWDMTSQSAPDAHPTPLAPRPSASARHFDDDLYFG